MTGNEANTLHLSYFANEKYPLSTMRLRVCNALVSSSVRDNQTAWPQKKTSAVLGTTNFHFEMKLGTSSLSNIDPKFFQQSYPAAENREEVQNQEKIN